MAYVATNHPQCVVSSFGGSPSIWVYTSDNAHADADASDFFTNGKAIGMKVGDIVHVVNNTSDAYTVTTHAVSVVDADGNATISAAVLV